jgi:hypothetical protein
MGKQNVTRNNPIGWSLVGELLFLLLLQLLFYFISPIKERGLIQANRWLSYVILVGVSSS